MGWSCVIELPVFLYDQDEPFNAVFLYYQSRRNMPARLRAFVDHAIRHRRDARSGNVAD